ncbi:MAG: hypothetical protein ACHREM_28605, partial [Polyangiales bacterium]
MRRSAQAIAISTILATISPARADAPTATVERPLGSGFVRVELTGGALVVSPCRGAACDAAKATRAAIDGAPASAELRPLTLRGGQGVHAIVSVTGGRAWEAIVVATEGGEPFVVWQGRTGLGDDGEGARVVERHDGVYVGKLRRGVGLCGRSDTMIEPRRVDVVTRSLRAVSLLPFDEDAALRAPTWIAVEATGAPIASVLVATGASTHDGAAPALTDGDLSTTWTEERSGDGRGEMVSFRVPAGVPLSRLSFVPRPTGAAPESFVPATEVWLSTDEGLSHVRLPSDPAPGARFDVKWAAPLSTRCLTVILDSASLAATARVGFAEIEGVPVLPSTVHSIDDLVGRLDEDEHAQSLAIAVLGGAGAAGAQAVARGLGALGDRGRDAAELLLESMPCGEGSDGLARLAWDAPKGTRDTSKAALDACGAAAASAIERAFLAGPARARDALASRFVKTAPARAIATIAPLLATSSPIARRALRSALADLPSREAGRAAI